MPVLHRNGDAISLDSAIAPSALSVGSHRSGGFAGGSAIAALRWDG